MEIRSAYKSLEWMQVRSNLDLTVCRFADAVGYGRGRPFDYLRTVIAKKKGVRPKKKKEDVAVGSPKKCAPLPLHKQIAQRKVVAKSIASQETVYTQHGRHMEVKIREAYEQWTELAVRQSGIYVQCDHYPKLGATPDGNVYHPISEQRVGICEFKAPFHSCPETIPDKHLVQIMGELLLSKMLWCDYVAVCEAERKMLMARVYAHEGYFDELMQRLRWFWDAVKSYVKDGTENVNLNRDVTELDEYRKQIKIEQDDHVSYDAFIGHVNDLCC